MICPYCKCDPCICRPNNYSSSSAGTTNYCVLCEQANRKIEKAIEILKESDKHACYRITINQVLKVLEGK